MEDAEMMMDKDAKGEGKKEEMGGRRDIRGREEVIKRGKIQGR